MSNSNSKDCMTINQALSYTSFVSVATASGLASANKVQVIGPSGEQTCQIELTERWIRFLDHQEPHSLLFKYAWDRVKYLMFNKQELRIKLKPEANNKVELYCHFGSEDKVNIFERTAALYKFIVKYEKKLNVIKTILYGRTARFYVHNGEEVGKELSGHKLPETDNRPIKTSKVKSFAGEEDHSSKLTESTVEASKNPSKLFTQDDHNQDQNFLSNNLDVFDFMKRQEFLRGKMQGFCKDLEDKI